MTFRFQPEPYWEVAVAGGVLALAAAAWGYYNARRAGFTWVATAAFALRAGAIAAVLLFVGNPCLEYQRLKRNIAFAILVDSSASMDYATASGTSRLGKALATARLVARAVEDAGGEVRFFDFARYRRPWGNRVPEESYVRRGDRSASDGARALRELMEIYRPPFAGIVVLSDGRWDWGPDVGHTAPCYTMHIGTTPANSVFLYEPDVPALALPGTTVPAHVRYETTLPPGKTCNITVTEYGGAATTYRAVPAGPRGELTAHVTVAGQGDHFYRLTAEPAGNDRWVHVFVPASRVKVWYWEMAGDADFAFLRRALAANEAFEVHYRLDVGGAVLGDAASPPPGTDIIIIGNPRERALAGGPARDITSRVANGGGLLFVVTARPPDAAALTRGAFAALTPVKVTGAVEERVEGKLRVNDAGRLYGDLAPPAMSHVWKLGELKPAAVAVWETAAGTPALTFMPYGLGRVGLLAAGGLYRQPRDADKNLLPQLAAAVILSLVTNQGEPVSCNPPVTEVRDRVEIVCRSAKPAEVTVADPTGKVWAVALRPVGADAYVGEFEPGAPGRHVVTARVLRPDGDAEIVKRAFLATAGTEEKNAWHGRPEVLRHLAFTTGGSFFAEGQEDALARAVAAAVRRSPATPVTVTRRLWPPYVALAVGLLCLAAEWFARRRAGLP